MSDTPDELKRWIDGLAMASEIFRQMAEQSNREWEEFEAAWNKRAKEVAELGKIAKL